MTGFADLEAVAKAADVEWNSDASIRAEFVDKKSFVALRRAEAQGRTRTLSGAVVRVTAGMPTADQQSTAPNPATGTNDASGLAARQGQVRQENVGRRFAGLPEIPVPQV